MYNGLKFSLLLFMLFTIPVVFEAQKILELWLGTVPESAAEFCKLLLIVSLFNLINKILCIGISATGKMKRISLITGSLYLMALPVIYVIFKFFSVTPSAAYITTIVFMIMIVCSNIIILKFQIPKLTPLRFLRGIFEAFAAMLVASLPLVPIHTSMDSNFLRIVVICVVYATLLSLITYFFCIDKSTRQTVNRKISDTITRFKR